MTPDPHRTELPEGRPDPVADFFSRERGAVTDRGTSDAHWHDILARAQRERRRTWPAYLVGAAAALALVATITLGFGNGDGVPPTTTPPAGSSIATTVASGTITSTPTTLSTTVAPPAGTLPRVTSSTAPTDTATSASIGPSTGFPQPVPALRGAWSVSNAGSGHVVALATAGCPQPCPVLLGSADNASSWRMYARFPAYASPGSGNGTYLSDVRFATPRIGFVYGSTVLRTLDGGLTWRPLPYGGGTVLSLETDGSTVWVVTGACVGRPPDGACTGITVHRAGVTDASTSRVTVAQLAGQPSTAWAARTWLALDQSTAYLNISGQVGPGAGFTATRISGPPTVLPRGVGCDPAAAMTVVPTANNPGTLFALCATGASGSATSGYQLSRSSDGGASWQLRRASALGPVTADGPVVTAASSDSLVGITGASGAGDLVRTGDGGMTWQVVGRGGAVPVGGWSWVGAAGGGLVYAIHADQSLMVSTNRGQSFTMDNTVHD